MVQDEGGWVGSSHLVEESWSCPIVWLRPKVKLNWLDIEMEFIFTRTILPKKTMSHCFYSHVPSLLGRPIVGEGGVKAMVENGIVEEGRPCQIPLLSSSMRTIRKIEIDLANLKKWEQVFLYIDVCYWESIQLWQNIVAFDIPFIFCLWYFFADQYMRLKGSQNVVCFFPRSIFSSFSNRNDGK